MTTSSSEAPEVRERWVSLLRGRGQMGGKEGGQWER